MPPSQARRIGLRTHPHDAAVALRAYARGQTIRHRTAAVALRPGHAAVSLWLNSGVPATEVARGAGHGIAALLKIYAHRVDGQADAATSGSPTPSASPRPSRTLAMKATPTVMRQPEAAGHPP